MHPPSQIAVAAWSRLMRVSRDVLDRVESDLRAAGLPPLAWYDALLELRRRPEGMRPVELQKAMLLAQYNLSRLLDRLETAGLVTRAPCPEDRRGQVVRVTDAGLALQREIWPRYRDAIAERFAGKLTEAEAATLHELLGKLTD
jgi:DNA-binding MarR family transcriptional regulator